MIRFFHRGGGALLRLWISGLIIEGDRWNNREQRLSGRRFRVRRAPIGCCDRFRGAALCDLLEGAGASPRPRREESAPKTHGGKRPRPISEYGRLPIS